MPRTCLSRVFNLRTLTAAVVLNSLVGRAEQVSFRNDVMAVLSKAGCNAGGCHGNASGKAGFKLSLRGQDPDLDYLALTRDQFGRRVNPLDPSQSLILLKATTALAHEGGKRFDTNSSAYATLTEWIAHGAVDDVGSAPKLERLDVSPGEEYLVEPKNETQIHATALFSDGSKRDVTTQAVYEVANQVAQVSAEGQATKVTSGETTILVRYLDKQQPVRLAFIQQRSGFGWSNPKLNNLIDEQVFLKLRKLRMNPSSLCSDEVFLRRAYLDLLGLLPTPSEARSFVADKHRNKREKVIDELLQRPEFADYWALKWADLLRVEDRALDHKGAGIFHRWIRDSIAAGKPMDQFARELITASGSTYMNPPANFYRANRDPVTRAEAVAQVFLGTRLQCAQCHNHPFDRWTQNDYYDWAAVFARVNYKVLRNDRRDENDKHEFKGEQVVFLSRHAELKNPRLGKAAEPRVLGSSAAMPLANDNQDEPSDARRVSAHSNTTNNGQLTTDHRQQATDELHQLARWLTSPTNTFFSRAQVNRIWFHLMGRGIVDPIDDFRPTNPASHPELLDALAADFVKHSFDLRHTIRTVMNSRVYQLSSEPNDTNRDDEQNFSHAYIRRLTAEQLLDCQHEVLEIHPALRGYPAGTRASQLAGAHTEKRRGEKIGTADLFLELFGKPQRLLTCECERSMDTTMSQAFQLISGPSVNDLLNAPDNRIGRLIATDQRDTEVVTELYWAALTRPPTAIESDRCSKMLAAATNRRSALEDLTWGLLNAKEFVLRQ